MKMKMIMQYCRGIPKKGFFNHFTCFTFSSFYRVYAGICIKVLARRVHSAMFTEAKILGHLSLSHLETFNGFKL